MTQTSQDECQDVWDDSVACLGELAMVSSPEAKPFGEAAFTMAQALAADSLLAMLVIPYACNNKQQQQNNNNNNNMCAGLTANTLNGS